MSAHPPSHWTPRGNPLCSGYSMMAEQLLVLGLYNERQFNNISCVCGGCVCVGVCVWVGDVCVCVCGWVMCVCVGVPSILRISE